MSKENDKIEILSTPPEEKLPSYPGHFLTPAEDLYSNNKFKTTYKRLALLALFFTLSLWFTDRYLRYNLIETKYRIAVSLEPESARPIMRSVVKELQKKLDTSEYSLQYLQYIEFLASIEEGDEVLKLYESIYPFNNQNPEFLIRLGCREYLLGNYEKAKIYFSEAGNLAPLNSLSNYLLLSANFKLSTYSDFDALITTLIKENINNHSLIFPEPFWHPSLPVYSYAYYLRKKETYERALSPIYELCYSVTNHLTDLGRDSNPYPSDKVKTVLEGLYLMGEKIARKTILNDQYLGSLPLHLSLTIQRHILHYYENTKEKLKIKSDLLESEKSKISKISENLDLLSSLNSEREKTFEKSKNNLFFLLLTVVFNAVGLLLLYLVSKLFNHLLTDQSPILSQPNRLSVMTPLLWVIIFTIILFLLTPNSLYSPFSVYSHSSILKILVIANFFIPLLISIVESYKQNSELSNRQTLKKNTFLLFTFYFENTVFFQLYSLIIGISIWFLAFRFLFFSYPYQLNLVPDLLTEREIYLVQSIIKQY
ncbi:MAG: hypothetical protein N3G21_05345 [Candidatus Hydrogenedentes bacterium]|nr:hypothetical protein [Candidatus Hydrogenedentota bacterium]